MEIVTANLNTARVRRAVRDGREHFVAPMSPVTGVYCWLNTQTGKRYVGSGAGQGGVYARRVDHLRGLRAGKHCNRLLLRAWNKYGEEAFEFSVLEECLAENCVAKESWWINFYDAANPRCGYNLCKEGFNSLGIKRSHETRRKISEAMKGWKPGQKMLDAARAANLGRKIVFSEGHKGKIAAAARRRPPMSGSTKAKISAAGVGRTPSEETRAKLRLAKKNLSQETRARLSTAQLNLSPEVAAKIAAATAESNRNRVWTTEMRERVSNSLTGHVRSEESKRKQSESARGQKRSEAIKLNMSLAAKKRWADYRAKRGVS